MTITKITTITVKVDQNTEISNFEQKLFEKITFKKKRDLKTFQINFSHSSLLSLFTNTYVGFVN